MKNLVDLNGAILPIEQTNFGQLAPGYAFPRGLFETIRLIDGRPAFLMAHWERLAKSAAALGLTFDSSADDLGKRILALAEAMGEPNGNVRLMLFDDDGCCVSQLMVVRPHPYTSAHYEMGFRLLSVLDERAIGAPAHKVTNYEKNRLARRHAQENGFDEALFVGEAGQIFEGAATNLFLVKNGALWTTCLEDGILPGVARRQVIERGGFPVEEKTLTREMIHEAEEVFVTNALVGVMPVSRVDELTFAIEDYKVVPQLAAAFRAWQR